MSFRQPVVLGELCGLREIFFSRKEHRDRKGTQIHGEKARGFLPRYNTFSARE